MNFFRHIARAATKNATRAITSDARKTTITQVPSSIYSSQRGHAHTHDEASNTPSQVKIEQTKTESGASTHRNNDRRTLMAPGC